MRNKRKLLSLLLALTMLFTLLPAPVAYAEGDESMLDDEVPVGEYSVDGTQTQPFPSGAANSQYFRIPAIVTLNDGTLVAAADARWDHTNDNGGIDTLIAISEDNGATWTNVWGNYLGSNAETGVHDSVNGTLMDPSLATDGETVYMLVDLFPRGNSNLSTGLTGDAFTADGHMRLSAGYVGNNENGYTYYLSAFTNEADEAAQRASIVDSEGKTVENYTVDRWFNLYLNGAKVSNLFYADADYQAYPISYLYLTKSADKGKTWSAPTLIDVKENGEIFYGPGTGSGIVTSDGTIIFPCYSCKTIASNLHGSYIYSRDNGKTWTRSWGYNTTTFQNTSSEAAIAEVKAGGNTYLYSFTRYYGTPSVRGAYYVSNDGGATWTEKTGLNYTCGSAMGVITYSKLVDGKPAMLLSAHSSSGRNSGVIYVITVADDGTLMEHSSYSVNNGQYYAYSDLTELNDGTIGLLYESAGGSITYKAFDMATLAPGAVLTDYPAAGTDPNPGTTPETPETPVTPPTITVKQGEEEIPAELTLPAEGEEAPVYTLTASEECTWTVDKPDVVTLAARAARAAEVVGESVDVTPVGEGTATITATPTAENGTPATVQLTVKAAAANDAVTEHVTVNLTVDQTSSIYTQDGSLTATGADPSIATVSAETINTPGATTYEPATLAEGTFYVSTSSSATNPTAQLTFEAVGDGTYYIKNSSGSYIYPDASRSVFSWNYSLGSGQKAVTVTESNGGYEFKYAVSDTTFTGSTVTTTAYLTLSGSSFGASGTAATLYLYTANTAEGTTTTNVTFTGTGEGTTVVTVGNTEYTVNVSAPKETLGRNLSFNGTLNLSGYANIKITSGSDIVSLSGSEIIAGSTSGTAIVTYDEVNDGGKAIKHYECTISVADVIDATLENSPFVGGSTNQANRAGTVGIPSENKKMTRLTISQGLTFDVDLENGNDTDAVWEIEDTTIATVDSNGVVTAKAAGETYLKATVNGVTYKMPVKVLECDELDLRDTTSTGSFDDKDSIQHYYITEVTNSRAYYSIAQTSISNGQGYTDLEEIFEGDVLYISRPGHFGITFFGAPNDGYALVAMGSTLSENPKFNALRNSDGDADFEGTSSFYKSGLVTNIKNSSNANCSDEQVKALINAACALGCDGGQGFCADKHTASGIAFRSEKLPDIQKEVISVNGKPYEEGMTAQVGDQIVFRITITANSSSITYNPATLTEETGFHFSGTSSTTKSVGSDLGTAGTYTYDVSYTVKQSDIDTTITNKVELEYTYKSEYSSGSRKANATATASISAVSLEVEDIIIDFGLPVTCDYTSEMENAGYTFASGTGSANYGTVTVNSTSVVYTPDKNFASRNTYDTVRFKNSKGGEYSFKVYPASNVLYEETFFTAATGWTKTGTTPSAQQASQLANAEGENYGFDTAYDSAVGSLGVYAATGLTPTTSTTGALTTTFYGNGFDLIGTCAPTSGHILLVISKLVDGSAKGGYIKSVDTRYKNDTIYQVPFAHVELGEDATWQVKIIATGLAADEANGHQAGTFVEIDAFRVYRSADTSNTTTTGVSAYYAPSEQDITYVNILDAVDSTITAYTENENELTIDVLAYEGAGGPQNEIYLANGQSVQIKVNGAAESIQVSLRAVNGETSWNADNDISSYTEMYYDVAVENGVATITNTGDALLAIGNVKVPSGVTVEGPAAAEPEALVYSLRMALTSAPVYDPFVNVDVISTSVIRNKLVTLSISTSTDVKTLTVNGKLLRPTNSIAVKYGWSDTYTYAFVETVRRGETKDYTIVATNADGLTCTRTVQG